MTLLKSAWISLLVITILISSCIPVEQSKTVDELKERIEQLEAEAQNLQRFNGLGMRTWGSCEPNTINKYNQPDTSDIEVDPVLLTWYYEQEGSDPQQTIYSSTDESYLAFKEKALENIEAFITLTASLGDENPYMSMALEDTISYLHYPVLITYLKTSGAITDIAYRKGLYGKYKSEFLDAFDYWHEHYPLFTPFGLASAAIDSRDPDRLNSIRQHAIEGFDRSRIFNLLSAYQTPNLDKLATTVWNDLSFNEHKSMIKEASLIGAKYAGIREALYELSFQWSITPEVEREYLEYQLKEVISIGDLNLLDDVVMKLEYSAKRKKWYLPNE